MKNFRLALLPIALFGIQFSQASALTASSNDSETIVYSGAAALQKETQVLELAIASTARDMLSGTATQAQLDQLIVRQNELKSSLAQVSSGIGQTVENLYGCGQSIQLAISLGATPGGTGQSLASANVAVSNRGGISQGLLYTFAKDWQTGQFDPKYQSFRFDSAVTPPGTYNVSVESRFLGTFGGCLKAYASASITDSTGNTLACNSFPVFLERVVNTPSNSCDGLLQGN